MSSCSLQQPRPRRRISDVWDPAKSSGCGSTATARARARAHWTGCTSSPSESLCGGYGRATSCRGSSGHRAARRAEEPSAFQHSEDGCAAKSAGTQPSLVGHQPIQSTFGAVDGRASSRVCADSAGARGGTAAQSGPASSPGSRCSHARCSPSGSSGARALRWDECSCRAWRRTTGFWCSARVSSTVDCCAEQRCGSYCWFGFPS
mmetsp:Transcript_61337/g.163042  ORF Transcript_61337/g.163042 Transcript_61337/m.163042 type:complete len:205 (+) Transcript_61337:488-1102(+)